MQGALKLRDCCMYLGLKGGTLSPEHAALNRHFADNPPTPILEVARALHARRSEIMRERAREHLAILKRHALIVGRIALFVRLLYNTVHYRPGGGGQKWCHEDFEAAAQEQGA
jgi:hypothetical protein